MKSDSYTSCPSNGVSRSGIEPGAAGVPVLELAFGDPGYSGPHGEAMCLTWDGRGEGRARCPGALGCREPTGCQAGCQVTGGSIRTGESHRRQRPKEAGLGAGLAGVFETALWRGPAHGGGHREHGDSALTTVPTATYCVTLNTSLDLSVLPFARLSTPAIMVPTHGVCGRQELVHGGFAVAPERSHT